MAKCFVCNGNMPEKGGLAVSVKDLQPGRITAVVPLDSFMTTNYVDPQHLVCGKECAVARFNEELNSLLGVRPAMHMGPEKRKCEHRFLGPACMRRILGGEGA